MDAKRVSTLKSLTPKRITEKNLNNLNNLEKDDKQMDSGEAESEAR
jgi:hypothetical protein